jgi:hypothetical protein
MPARTIQVELRSDKPCEFHWIKSQGDCAITYQTPDKSKATITIPHQADFPVQRQDGETVISNRVEVVAVAFDGTHYSSPVFLTEYFTPAARQAGPRMNEILVYADDSFVMNLNGQEILSGNQWNQPYRKKEVAWGEADTLDIAVTNKGGAGGLFAACWVGDKLHMSDYTWVCSLNGVDWVAPVVTRHEQSEWAKYFAAPIPNATWVWHPQAGESVTVYFRKVFDATVPTPEPTDLSQRVAALEATLSKIKEALR